MKKLINLSICAFIMSCAFPSLALAQLFPFIAPLKFAEKDLTEVHRNLYGQDQIAPGKYHLVNLNSQLCMTTDLAGILGPKYVQKTCSGNGLVQPDEVRMQIAILPTNDGRYTIRFDAYSGFNKGASHCATVARNVIFGAPDIDLLPCDLPINSNEWGDAGVEDQRFTFRQVGNGYFEIRTSDNKCWAIRNGSKSHGEGIIKWDCTGGADQRWKAEFIDANLTPKEIDSLRVKGWHLRAGGLKLAKPVGGWYFQGSQISKTQSANDNGKSCATSCLDTASCKAFTWRPAALDNTCNGQSCCALFSSVYSSQMLNDNSYSGVILK